MDMNEIVFASVGLVGAFFFVIFTISFIAYKVKGNSNVKKQYY